MNESKAEGVFDEAKGKIKQAVGNTFGDEKMADSGAADEVKGHAKQTWGNVKDTAHDLTHDNSTSSTGTRAEDTGHSIRNDVTSAAEHAKDSIKRGLDHLEHKADR